MWWTRIPLRAAELTLLLASVFAVVVAPEIRGQAPDDEISRVYFENARRFYQAGNLSGARELLETALEFDVENSDAHFLRAETLRDIQSETGSAIAALERALEAGNFRAFSPYAARAALVSTLIRTRQLERAAERLEALSPSGRIEENAQRRLLEARLLALRGDGTRAVEVAHEELSRFPSDARFMKLVMAERDKVGLQESQLLRRHRSSALAGDYKEDYLAAVLWFMRKSNDPALVREWGENYFEMGGEDPLASVLLIENGADASNEIERFSTNGGKRERWLLYRFTEAAGNAAAGLRDDFASLSGELINDRNRNGFYEARYRYTDGRLRQIVTDRNEDGVTEHEISFAENGVLTEARIASGQLVEYSDYPEAERVAFDDATYRVIPGRIEIPLFDPVTFDFDSSPGPLDPMPRMSTPAILSEEVVRPHAYVREATLDGVPTIERLGGGTVIERAFDHNGDGEIDYYVVFEERRPSRAVRDIDFDGYFEASERYSGGILTVIAVDSDDNGQVDYVRHLASDPAQRWDFNEDGRFDASALMEATRPLREQLAETVRIDDIVGIWRDEIGRE